MTEHRSQAEGSGLSPDQFPDPALDIADARSTQVAVLAGGCFWCTEAVYRDLTGVSEVVSGYAGGTAATANYDTVCNGDTDHAEAIRITFDPAGTTYGQLLKLFFSIAHDPTQLNRQGADRGRQYRSTIFYADDEQKTIAEAYIGQLTQARAFPAPIVTTLEPLIAFYPAETYHRDFAARNPSQPYIQAVAIPKIQKLHKYFPDRLRKA